MCSANAGISVTQWTIFRFFCPAGETRCTNWGEICRGGVDLLHARFHPNRCTGKVCSPKTKNFTKIVAYKCAAGAYPVDDFYQIFIICKQLHVQSGIKIWADSVKRLRNFGGLSLGVRTYPKFSAFPSGESMRQRVQARYGPHLSPRKYGEAQISHAAGGKKV